MLNRFGGVYQGLKSCWFDSLVQYEHFTNDLLDYGISFKTKILKKRGMPTQYYVLLIE